MTSERVLLDGANAQPDGEDVAARGDDVGNAAQHLVLLNGITGGHVVVIGLGFNELCAQRVVGSVIDLIGDRVSIIRGGHQQVLVNGGSTSEGIDLRLARGERFRDALGAVCQCGATDRLRAGANG